MKKEDIKNDLILNMINTLEEPTRTELISSLKELAMIRLEDPDTAEKIIKQIVQKVSEEKSKCR